MMRRKWQTWRVYRYRGTYTNIAKTGSASLYFQCYNPISYSGHPSGSKKYRLAKMWGGGGARGSYLAHGLYVITPHSINCYHTFGTHTVNTNTYNYTSTDHDVNALNHTSTDHDVNTLSHMSTDYDVNVLNHTSTDHDVNALNHTATDHDVNTLNHT